MASNSDNTFLMNDHTVSGESSATIGNQATPLPEPLLGMPDSDAEVIALSTKTLMERNKFVCEICYKGFQREQNLQLHMRGHNLPMKLGHETSEEIKKRVLYICPEENCVIHDPSRALGDLIGLQKHFFKNHVEKKWDCDKCSKKYAFESDLKAHSKICGTNREYKCVCGTLFSRRDSFIQHRAFCNLLGQESKRIPLISSAVLAFPEPHMPAAPPAPVPVDWFSTLSISKPGKASGDNPSSSLSVIMSSMDGSLDIAPATDTNRPQKGLI